MHKGSRAKGNRKHSHSKDYSKTGKRKASREDELLTILKLKKDPMVLILDHVQDPHNLGACLRTADGAGCSAVIAPKDRSSPLNETVRRIACGAAESIPYIQVTNLSRTMKIMKDEGFWLVGTSDNADQSIYEIDLKGKVGIIMGAEGKGLRRLTEEKCDFLGKLPMMGSVECLNVSVATGICLYEAVRQRNL
ncbi:MAG: 23S rRNA (guanosine(2251)-2'-O)-methyltransferase RlmB [Verrucomicrobiales bacterium]|tara:strand:+ start:289 stop:867 length:579 start_codon:yes stop_codon:yes gene_type:complete